MIVDNREKNSLVVSELAAKKVNFELKRLDVADYIVGNVAIERKTLSDFVSSMISKRLIRQLSEMKQYKQKLLIVEGNDLDESRINPNAVRGMILSILLDFNVPIVFTKDSEETATFLTLLNKRQGKKSKDISLKAKKLAYSLAEQQQFILESFPGVGASTAKGLLKKFKTIKNFILADKKDIAGIKRLSEKKAKVIREIINKKYKD